jgi:hypothetical protein
VAAVHRVERSAEDPDHAAWQGAARHSFESRGFRGRGATSRWVSDI